MEEINIAFNHYIEEVKKLDISSKRNELIESIKQLIGIFETLALEEGVELHYLKSREILNLNKQNVSEDEFIEASLVYLEVAKNVIGEYLYNTEK